METLDVSFGDSDTVYNIVSKAILSEQAKADILIIIPLEMICIRNLKTKGSIVKSASGIKCLRESYLHLNQQQKLLKQN